MPQQQPHRVSAFPARVPATFLGTRGLKISGGKVPPDLQKPSWNWMQIQKQIQKTCKYRRLVKASVTAYELMHTDTSWEDQSIIMPISEDKNQRKVGSSGRLKTLPKASWPTGGIWSWRNHVCFKFQFRTRLSFQVGRNRHQSLVGPSASSGTQDNY